MKLVWCPDTASKSYIDAVRALSTINHGVDTTIAEFIAAMAGGWKSQLVVEALARSDSPATSIALATAVKHTRGRRVVVPEEDVGSLPAAEEGVDFVVVDMRRRDAGRVVREAKAGPRGMVVVCKNVSRPGGMLTTVGTGMRLVRSAYLPIGRGLEVLHVGVGKGPRLGAGGATTTGARRWFKHVDRVTGEEHLFRN